MKLEIDTEKDSRATLKGVLRMLQAILGEEGNAYSNRPVDRQRSRNIFEDDSPTVSMYGDTGSSSSGEYPSSGTSGSSSSSGGSGGIFSMFGDPSASTPSSSSSGSASGISTMKEEDDDETPQIQIY